MIVLPYFDWIIAFSWEAHPSSAATKDCVSAGQGPTGLWAVKEAGVVGCESQGLKKPEKDGVNHSQIGDLAMSDLVQKASQFGSKSLKISESPAKSGDLTNREIFGSDRGNREIFRR